MLLKGLPLELDKYNRPMTVAPCLSDGLSKRCGTAEKVGYSCVGCIGAKFPLNKPLFHLVEIAKKELPTIPPAEMIFFSQGGQSADEGTPAYG